MINVNSLLKGLSSYGNDGPFDHCIIDDFLKRKLLCSLKRNFQISIEELANLVNYVVNKNVKIFVKNKINKNVLPERYVPDITFAKDKLDLFPRVSLEESVKSTAEWFLTNG